MLMGIRINREDTKMQAIRNVKIENRLTKNGLMYEKLSKSTPVRSLVSLFSILPEGTLWKNLVILAESNELIMLVNSILFLLI